MNCVDYAINQIVNGGDISSYVLGIAFATNNNNYLGNSFFPNEQFSVQDGIKTKVIYPVVLPGCNMLGGVTETIDLTGSRLEYFGNGDTGVNVPDAITGGREIISVIEVYPGSLNSINGLDSSSASCGVGVLNEALGSLVSTLSTSANMPKSFTSFTRTGRNSFIIHRCSGALITLSAKVIMSYDKGLSSIHPRHFSKFTTLCEYAVKAYIYKNCRIPTEEAIMKAGVPLEIVRDEISQYADAYQNYKEYLDTTWTNCMAHSDAVGKRNSLEMATPGRI